MAGKVPRFNILIFILRHATARKPMVPQRKAKYLYDFEL